MSSSVSSRRSDVVSMLLVDASEDDHASIAPHLGAYPIALLERLVDRNCRVRPLNDGERYRDASPALWRLGVDVDAWPVPPAGLFVVEERPVIREREFEAERRRAYDARQAAWYDERDHALAAIDLLPPAERAELHAAAARGPAGIKLSTEAPQYVMNFVAAFRRRGALAVEAVPSIRP